MLPKLYKPRAYIRDFTVYEDMCHRGDVFTITKYFGNVLIVSDYKLIKSKLKKVSAFGIL